MASEARYLTGVPARPGHHRASLLLALALLCGTAGSPQAQDQPAAGPVAPQAALKDPAQRKELLQRLKAIKERKASRHQQQTVPQRPPSSWIMNEALLAEVGIDEALAERIRALIVQRVRERMAERRDGDGPVSLAPLTKALLAPDFDEARARQLADEYLEQFMGGLRAELEMKLAVRAMLSAEQARALYQHRPQIFFETWQLPPEMVKANPPADDHRDPSDSAAE